MNRTLILIQGRGDYAFQNALSWDGYDVLFSTWIGEESKFTIDHDVIYNEQPKTAGPANFNYQRVSTYNGLIEAKNRCYTHVLKIRNDVFPTNTRSFMDCMDYNALNFLCWHEHEVYPSCPGYLVDYLMFGEIDQMLALWDIESNFCEVPEVILTWNYITKCSADVRYFLDDLRTNNDLYWIKNNLLLSTYQAKHGYDKYKKYDFSTSKENLSLNYLNFLNKPKQ